MLLRPVHEFIFGVLRRIPTDATHNQDRAVDRAVRIIQRTKYAACYDLSAATDRLPLSLQMAIMDINFSGSGQL